MSATTTRAAVHHAPLPLDRLPSWVLARRLAAGKNAIAALGELARRFDRETERLEDDPAPAIDFASWVSGLADRPPGRPRGRRDRRVDAGQRRSLAQRRRRERERQQRMQVAA